MMAEHYSTSGDVPSYASHRMSQQFDPDAPPPPPPKPNSQEVSRQGTPASASQTLPPPPPETPGAYSQVTQTPEESAAHAWRTQDPGFQWLPKILQDKSKQDLAEILSKPELLSALAHAEETAHPSTAAAQEPLRKALQENLTLATHLTELEDRLNHLRSSTQAQLLATHALERQWKQKQSEMDRALSPFSPSSLYQRLGQSVNEQVQVCEALEESFLDGDGGMATEREMSEWVKRYRDSKKLYYSRREKKDRFDEGRVGGWR